MNTLGGITLPDDCNLTPETELAPQVAAIVEFSTGQAANVWEASRGGRALDVAGGEDYGWIQRTGLLDLIDLAAVPGGTYTLILHGSEYTVRFRHEAGAVIFAAPVVDYAPLTATDYYNNLLIKLMEV